mgnify:CR=1 FL=1
MIVPSTAMAKEKPELSPIEIDQELADTEPIEIGEGIYLRDNGEVSIIDIDISQFESL